MSMHQVLATFGIEQFSSHARPKAPFGLIFEQSHCSFQHSSASVFDGLVNASSVKSSVFVAFIIFKVDRISCSFEIWYWIDGISKLKIDIFDSHFDRFLTKWWFFWRCWWGVVFLLTTLPITSKFHSSAVKL